MSDFEKVLGEEVASVWDEVVGSFDARIPISEDGAWELLDRARDEKDQNDRLYILCLFVMMRAELEGFDPYSADALDWLSHGLFQIRFQLEDESSYEDTEEHIKDMISRGQLDPGDVNAYLAAREKEAIADGFDDLLE